MLAAIPGNLGGRDDRFYLTGLEGQYLLTQGDPLLVDWCSGTLRVPIGESLGPWGAGFGALSGEEVLVEVERGVVTGIRSVIHPTGRSNLPPVDGSEFETFDVARPGADSSNVDRAFYALLAVILFAVAALWGLSVRP